jgi:PEP-CTERM motif
MRRSSIVAALTLVWGLSTTPAGPDGVAEAVPLQNLIEQNRALAVGDKVFTDFAFTPTARLNPERPAETVRVQPLSARDIDVTTFTRPGTIAGTAADPRHGIQGLRFTGPFLAENLGGGLGGPQILATIAYDVHVLRPELGIAGVGQSFTGELAQPAGLRSSSLDASAVLTGRYDGRTELGSTVTVSYPPDFSTGLPRLSAGADVARRLQRGEFAEVGVGTFPFTLSEETFAQRTPDLRAQHVLDLYSGSAGGFSRAVVRSFEATYAQGPRLGTRGPGDLFFEGADAIPEPSTLLLLGTGALAVGGAAWRRRRARAS